MGSFKKSRGPDYGSKVMIVAQAAKKNDRLVFHGPNFQLRRVQFLYLGPVDHGNRSLMMAAFTDPFQFFIFADFIGPFPFRQNPANTGKMMEPVFPEKEAVNIFRMNITQGFYRIKAADRQFIGKVIKHNTMSILKKNGMGYTFPMMGKSITTKRGDGGLTDFAGARIRKDDPRIETLGALDELDAFLADAALAGPDGNRPEGSSDQARITEIIEKVRKDLTDLMGQSADGASAGTERLEGWLTELEEKHSPGGFIHHWTKPAAIKLNIARTICRRAERNMIRYGGNGGPENDALAAYLNRLSDLLFLLAAASEVTANRSA
jgi:cob(I)alamin adenosyltransferase